MMGTLVSYLPYKYFGTVLPLNIKTYVPNKENLKTVNIYTYVPN